MFVFFLYTCFGYDTLQVLFWRCQLGCRCVPFRYKSCDSSSEKIVEVLMINSPSGPGLLFPKV